MANTRKQMFLEKINDSTYVTPTPITSEEEILNEIGESGGSGGGFSLISIQAVETADGVVGNPTVDLGGKTINQIKEEVMNGTVYLAKVYYKMYGAPTGMDEVFYVPVDTWYGGIKGHKYAYPTGGVSSTAVLPLHSFALNSELSSIQYKIEKFTLTSA